MSPRTAPSSRPAVLALFASLAAIGCGVGAPSTFGASTAALDSLVSSVDPGPCLGALKEQVYAKTLTLAEYEARARSECGVDFSEKPAGGTDGAGEKTPGEPKPGADTQSAEELAFNACASAVKDEVLAGTLDVADFAQALATRCPSKPGAGQEGTPTPAPAPTAAELAYAACANAVKAEVLSGALAISDYEQALATRCPPPPAAGK